MSDERISGFTLDGLISRCESSLGLVNYKQEILWALRELRASRAMCARLAGALENIKAVGHARDNVQRANDKLDACIEWSSEALAAWAAHKEGK